MFYSEEKGNVAGSSLSFKDLSSLSASWAKLGSLLDLRPLHLMSKTHSFWSGASHSIAPHPAEPSLGQVSCRLWSQGVFLPASLGPGTGQQQ